MGFKVFGLVALAAVSSSAAFAADTPRAGGTLNVALQRQADCIDPQQSNYGYGSVDGRQLVDSLTDQSYAEPTKIVPWLAKSWEISDDARTFTFTLRDDVTFSDGSPLDSAVVKRNFEVLATFPGAAGGAYLKGIHGNRDAGRPHDPHCLRRAQRALPPGDLDRRARHRLAGDARQDRRPPLRRGRRRHRAVRHRERDLQRAGDLRQAHRLQLGLRTARPSGRSVSRQGDLPHRVGRHGAQRRAAGRPGRRDPERHLRRRAGARGGGLHDQPHALPRPLDPSGHQHEDPDPQGQGSSPRPAAGDQPAGRRRPRLFRLLHAG